MPKLRRAQGEDDPGLGKLLLQHLREEACVFILRGLHLEVQADPIAGSVQAGGFEQRFGTGDVVRVGVCLGSSRPVAWGQERPGRRRLPAPDGMNDRLPVHGAGDGLAHAYIRQRAGRGVEVEVHDARRRSGFDAQTSALRERVNHVGWKLVRGNIR